MFAYALTIVGIRKTFGCEKKLGRLNVQGDAMEQERFEKRAVVLWAMFQRMRFFYVVCEEMQTLPQQTLRQTHGRRL